ncbi:MAG TPA: hypothetical protein VJS44_16725 [Pyrinomonadaceae bacterium]|nr:hypothetical protein [Pyrinomonadaceae bacterium]
MAARGTRNMDTGEESIEDKREVRQLKETARRVHRRALITAAIITLVVLAFPST